MISLPQQDFALNLGTSYNLLDEIIMPTSRKICAAELLGFISGLVSELYNEGSSLEIAFPHAWVANERCRQHTDFLILRPSRPLHTYIWSPRTRPLGVFLPSVRRYCTCCKSRWRFKHSSGWNTSEVLSAYACSVCKKRLTCTIRWDHPYQYFSYRGTSYILCEWPLPKKNIDFTGDLLEVDMDISEED